MTRQRRRPAVVPDGGSGDAIDDVDEGLHDAGETANRRVVVLNPTSGEGTHGDRVRELAAEYGYLVRETEAAGDAVALGREAAAGGANLVAACGGDGTINEVVRGIGEADAFDDVTFGVLPAGTGNNFAGNIGVADIEQGFEVLERGEVRRIDLGTANDRLFVNSCVSGLTAEASAQTSSEMKERFGVLAYVLTSLRTMADFEGFDLTVADADGAATLWEGHAIVAMIGNARRAGPQRVSPANVEDGLFDVTIVEEMPTGDLLQEAAIHRLFGEDGEHVTRLRAPSLHIDVNDPESIEFSLDGEMVAFERVDAEVLPARLRIHVGEAYEREPKD